MLGKVKWERLKEQLDADENLENVFLADFAGGLAGWVLEDMEMIR